MNVQHAIVTQSKSTHSSTTGDNNDTTQMIADHDTLELRTFQYTDHKLLDLESDIDPGNNFFSNINDYYYTDDWYI